MKDERHETIADIVAEMRNGPCCCLTLEDIPQHYRDNKLFYEFADRIEAAAKREREAGAELRKCLKAAVGEKCSMCAYIDNEMSAFYGEPVCGNKGCKYKRWRKALKGAKDEGM